MVETNIKYLTLGQLDSLTRLLEFYRLVQVILDFRVSSDISKSTGN